ncbi:hypothetical protein ACXVUM_18555 [Williamsia sp. SKLECPSW1]
MALRETSDVTLLSPISPHRTAGMTRRVALARGVAVAGLLGGVGVAAGCSTSSGPDAATRTAQQLVPLARAAGEDAVAARALSAQVPDRAAALRVIADERTVHLRALTDEISRLSADLVPSASPTSSAAPSAATPPVVTTVDALRTRLSGARTATGTLAVSSDGYRAGLLGSITASLAGLVEVQLG